MHAAGSGQCQRRQHGRRLEEPTRSEAVERPADQGSPEAQEEKDRRLHGGHLGPRSLERVDQREIQHYQVAYTSESLAAQIKNPQDRLEVVGKQISDAVGARILAGGYSYGEYDVSVIVDAADDVTMAAVAVAVAAGGAVRAAKTTPLLSGGQWVAALKKAPAVSSQYRPAR
jgi:uncharacterized protein with GYD domain